MRNFIKNQKGFTLIEMLIVLGIISILVLLVLPNASSILNAANKQGCEALTTTDEALKMANSITGNNDQVDPERLAELCAE